MKKLKFILFFVLVLGVALVTTSCTDMNALLSSFGLGTAHTCADANGDALCDTCGAAVAPAACKSHVDNNGDGKCDNTGCTATVLMEMEDVEFNDVTKTYNGKTHTLAVTGAPEGAEIEYSAKNKQKNVGKYEITATITADGYEDLELTATLTIKPLKIDFEWGDNSKVFPASGEAPELS